MSLSILHSNNSRASDAILEEAVWRENHLRFFIFKMLKVTAIVSLVLIGGTMWAASLSCESCGSECASACGTRQFRSCCFNYLRRKRGPDAVKFLPQNHHDLKTQDLLKDKPKYPVFIIDNSQEQWRPNMMAGEYRPYPYDDMVDNVLFDV